MTTDEIEYVRRLIRENRVHDFYIWQPWRILRDAILEEDRRECQLCKKHGRYSRAEIVHHVRHLRDHPELALCRMYLGPDGKEHRQLISVCKMCHETVCHPERLGNQQKRKKFWTAERWD